MMNWVNSKVSIHVVVVELCYIKRDILYERDWVRVWVGGFIIPLCRIRKIQGTTVATKEYTSTVLRHK